MAEINKIGYLMQFVHAFMLLEFIRAETMLPTTELTSMICKQQHENSRGIWGDVNPNIFYICDPETNMARELNCPEGRGFFNGLGYYGCIPFKKWPACIPPVVRSQNQNTSFQCDSEHLLEPWESNDPNKFYMCVDAAPGPVLVNCEIGKGFVSAVADRSDNSHSKIVGCATWEKWRAYMQCEQYY